VDSDAPVQPLGRLGTASLCALALVGCGEGELGSRAEPNLIGEYCAYDAMSTDALVVCIDRARRYRILRLDTNAARYARGELDRCLPDAGPFCAPR
jgi:hypothetical protein